MEADSPVLTPLASPIAFSHVFLGHQSLTLFTAESGMRRLFPAICGTGSLPVW